MMATNSGLRTAQPPARDDSDRDLRKQALAAVKTGIYNLRWLWLFAVICVAWWFWSAHASSPFFPPLEEILKRCWHLWILGDSIGTVTSSLQNFFIGYAAASILGVGLAMLLWRLPSLRKATSPLLYFVYVLPKVAILPAVAAVVGYGVSMKVTIIILSAIWPTLLNTIDGLRNVDAVKLDVAKVTGMSNIRTVRSVVLPNALPQVFAGLRNSLQIAIIMMVVSELIASTSGIGFFILGAQENFEFPEMWAGILLLAFIGSVLTGIFVVCERMVLGWHRSMRALERKP